MNWFTRKRTTQTDRSVAELAHLIGRANHVAVMVVTDRGVEIPISHAHGWTVLDMSLLLAEITAWPETEHPLGALA